MLYASLNNEKIEATPISRAICPLCGKEVFSKCGEINVWHWAHLEDESCDNWYEPETAWHKNWKNLFGKELSEIIITKNGEKHIADIHTKEDVVIELQNSSILKPIIRRRETFYGKRMLWIINGIDFKNNFDLIPDDRFFRVSQGLVHKNTGQLLKKGEKLFNWKWCRKSWNEAQRPVFIDFGEENLLWVKEGMGTSNCRGIYISKKKFIDKYLG
jgi:competence CoiA-like predicted nuclease